MWCAAHLSGTHKGTDMLRAHLHICFKSATAQNNGVPGDIAHAGIIAQPYAIPVPATVL